MILKPAQKDQELPKDRQTANRFLRDYVGKDAEMLKVLLLYNLNHC